MQLDGTTIVQIATAIAIVAGVYTSYKLNQRTSNDSEVVRLRRQVDDLQTDILAMLGYSFSLRTELANKGIQTPEPPHLKSQDLPIPPPAAAGSGAGS